MSDASSEEKKGTYLRESEKEEGESSTLATAAESPLETQINAGIHETRSEKPDTPRRGTRREHTGKLYARASFAGSRDPRKERERTPESFPKSITVRNAVDLLLEFRDSMWKGVDFRRPTERRPVVSSAGRARQGSTEKRSESTRTMRVARERERGKVRKREE